MISHNCQVGPRALLPAWLTRQGDVFVCNYFFVCVCVCICLSVWVSAFKIWSHQIIMKLVGYYS